MLYRVRLGYRPQLDGVRGVAILIVLAAHFTGRPLGGGMGVDLFFALSGFLITSLLLDEHDAAGDVSLSRFYARRARRLLPALFIVLAVFAAVEGARGNNPVGSVLAGSLYLSNFAVVRGSMAPALNHLWSLAEEEQFYLLWPIVLVTLLRWRRRAPWLFLLALFGFLAWHRIELVVAGTPAATLQFSPDTRLDGILLGCLFAFIYRRGHLSVRLVRLIVVAALPAAVYCIAVTGPTSRALHEYLLPLMALYFALLVYAAANDVLSVLEVQPMRYFGRISYSLYLWHIPVLYAFGVHLKWEWWPSLAALTVSLALASASTVLVEEPFRRRVRARVLQVQRA